MSIKVLVADDSITIQKVIGIIFGGDEYSLTVVDNGKSAVEKAREINPDILLIDALMPGMTGYEVAEAVRSTPSLAAKPILLLTGSFEPFDEDKAKKCGADDFIAKPFESQQIISKVKELLELGKSRALSSQISPPPYIPEPAPEVSIPTEEFSATGTAQSQQAERPQQEAPSDIWGAFTPEVEQLITTDTAPAAPAVTSEPDVFAIVTEEENDAQLVQTSEPATASQGHTGSQWVPVEENTFEFEEMEVADPQEALADQTASAEEPVFGDIAFEEQAAATIETPPAPFTPLEDVPLLVPESVAVAEAATPTETFSAINLTEEQLKAAITAASKEVIERIVWEVVPDLAEVLILEAIRKIKEGA